MANDPIHQFQIHELAGPFHIGGYEIAFTNSALFMGIAVATVTVILVAAAARGALVPAACSRWASSGTSSSTTW